ncbi:response regulator transcription factor [Paenibacillus sp. IB182496]|uniref:Response regulator transcription factor n=1 Tax=Paenibacillus sabuli TaxID=2772509 RepID=A0A927BVY9_9BACL|nr:response regulator transcription factor [Paenibacillus sabuli]MBD2846474.1 response regulator transcription factor [Paenibacillus sabuli]
MQRILLCEDDPKLAALLCAWIEKYGYEATAVTDFDDVTGAFRMHRPHLVLLDVNLPRFDGFYWCRQLRTMTTCPILFISARAGEMDQVMALEYGGDDYITKPFHYEVVMAKIRSHLRRVYGEYAADKTERVVRLDELALYPERMELQLAGQAAALTKKEAELLELLVTQSPRVVSRDTLLERLWDDQHFVDENTLNVNIARVRKKLQELGADNAIETVRGAGYRLLATWSAKEAP